MRLLILLILSTAAFAQSPTQSDTYCDNSQPIYAYNGTLYTCFNGKPTSAVQDGGGQVCNIKAYGAKQCPIDSTAAIQTAINSCNGGIVLLPAGKWCISAPEMYYTIPPTNGGYASGLKLEGLGFNVTQLLMLPSFTVPTTFPFAGATVYPAPSMIDVQGTISAAFVNGFQINGDIGGIGFSVYGCESNPAPTEPPCAYVNAPAWVASSPYNGLSAISLEGIWQPKIHDCNITYMSGDGIIQPHRLDINSDGDLDGVWGTAIDGCYLRYNLGNGINFSSAHGAIGTHQANVITFNSGHGIRVSGGSKNAIVNNSIAWNGCGQPVNNAHATDSINGTSWAVQTSCTTNPLGSGIWIGRDIGVGGGSPYNTDVNGNECDSNAAACVYISESQNVNFWSNQNFKHTNTGNFNSTYGGYVSERPKISYVLGAISGSTITLKNEYQRLDYFGGAKQPTSGADLQNAYLDPYTATLDLGFGSGSVQGEQNYFSSIIKGSAGNYVPYAWGGGVVFGVPTLSAPSGGQQTVTAWPVTNQGIGYSQGAPTLAVLGGDSAWAQPTYISVSQSGGVVQNTCTIPQAGGPYSRTPLCNIEDTPGGTGSGATCTITLTSGVPTACTITAGGTGYVNPIGGVAPVCQTQPVVSATASLGVAKINMTSAGNYGPWTPGTVAPSVTVTVADPGGSGTGFTGTAQLWPVNIGSNPENLVWGVAQVIIQDNQHGYSFLNNGSPTVTFGTPACGSPCVAATGSVQENWMINPTLTVSNAGSCDASTPVWVQAISQPAIGATNTAGDLINEQNLPITQPLTLYNAASNPLPGCATSRKNLQLTVSDATTPTFMGTYVSGGAVVAQVMCNGSSWVTY